ncbi:MAG TPA: (4Fe-4S)-binding protein [Sediminibacterium sp.]|nr:(4Fe-4S)-binding protein [Sediminibacterium sp.]
MPRTTFHYTNGVVTVVWKPEICIHSRICWTELRAVFDPFRKPWVDMEAGTTENIITQVRKCPSGALSYFLNESAPQAGDTPVAESGVITEISVEQDGPLVIKTDCRIVHSNGTTETKRGTTALCRCGASGNKPFCDGSHAVIQFKG